MQGQSPQQHQKGGILLVWGYGGKAWIIEHLKNAMLIMFMSHICKNEMFAMFRCCGQESSSDGADEPVDEIFFPILGASKWNSLHLSLSAPVPGEDVLY